MRYYILIGLVLAGTALTPASTPAAFSFFTTSGSGGDGALEASAGVTTSGANGGTIVIVLSNTLAANLFRSSGQAVCGFDFTLSDLSGTTFGTRSSGARIDISATGAITVVSGASEHWGTSTSGGNGLHVTALSGGKPGEMIAPFGTSYTDVNKGVRNFDPYYQGTAVITITGVTGVTSHTTVLHLPTFLFGTDGFALPAVHAVPEPTSFVLWAVCGVGAAGFTALSRRRRKA
jgi:hypothetical protein